MRIAIDISPLETGHKYRGTGFYVLHLTEALKKYFPENEYILFTNKNEIPKNIDIIHYPYFDPFSLSLSVNNPKKTVVTVLDLTPIIFPKAFPAGLKGNVKWQLQKLALRKMGGIVTDSQSAKKDIERLVRIPKEKITVAYLAAGEEFSQIPNPKPQIAKIKTKYRLPEKFALYVGDVTWNKNLPRLVEAAGDTIPLIMVGKALVNTAYDKTNAWNKDLAKVQEYCKDHRNIQFLGFVPDEDLVTLYNIATVFIMPSLYEGFGLPILEAMACGCPVITSSQASLSEVAGDAAYVVDAHSIDSIAKGLQEVFTSGPLREELSQKGYAQVKNFSWKKTAGETLQAYEKVLENSKK